MSKNTQLIMLIVIIAIFIINFYKKDQQPRVELSSNDIKLDTTFQFTLKQLYPFDIINWCQKDFYTPILDSVANPELKVYRTLITTSSTTWQEVYSDSVQTPGPHFLRSKGYISYSEQILAFSAKITVRILAR